jgi:hypothetical protein
VIVMPSATGMALTCVLLAAAAARGPQARYVVWSRIDQKTCLKCITAANLEVGILCWLCNLCNFGSLGVTDCNLGSFEACGTSGIII